MSYQFGMSSYVQSPPSPPQQNNNNSALIPMIGGGALIAASQNNNNSSSTSNNNNNSLVPSINGSGGGGGGGGPYRPQMEDKRLTRDAMARYMNDRNDMVIVILHAKVSNGGVEIEFVWGTNRQLDLVCRRNSF